MALDHTLNDDERLIADGATKLFGDCFTSTVLRAAVEGKPLAEDARRSLGASGLLGVCAPEAVGGGGLGAVASLAVARDAGRRGAPWPVSESITAAAVLAGAQPEVARSLIAAESAATFVAGAELERGTSGSGQTLSGVVDALPWAGVARWMIVSMKDDLALVDLNGPGVERRPRKGVDPACPVARITLTNAAARTLAVSGRNWKALLQLLHAAELCGAAEACLALSVEYMKVRKQFGQEIGRFQALKHIAANDALFLENMRLAVDHAAWAQDAGADEAEMALHVARQYCADAARSVAEDAIQCHGGIGFTWDYDLQLYLRRILRLGATLGTASEHREAIATNLIARFSA